MKTSLRSHIFFFLILILFSMSLSFYIFFSTSAQKYINGTAGMQLSRELRYTKRQLSKSNFKKEEILIPDNLLLFDNELNLVYPQKQDSKTAELIILLTEHYLKKEANFTDTPFTLSAETKDYLIVITDLDQNNQYYARYAVIYTSLNNDQSLLRQLENLVLIITLLSALVFTPLLWILSGRLVKLRHNTFLGESMEAQRTIFQNTSHELRTPLMSIEGYAQAILDGIIPDTALAVNIIIQESERMKQLIDGILTMARLDTGAQEITPVSIDIYDYLTQLIERVQGIALSFKRELIFDASQNQVYAWLDPILLDKACSNLLTNALQYAKHYVYIQLSEQDNKIVIAFENDGAKLNEKEIPLLFQRFYKGNSGNFGIGLSIVKSAVEYMDGTISAENGVNGARFTIIIDKK